MKIPTNKKSTQELENLLQQQASKIAQLEKAQAVEAALDKVRARTMAMQHPDELREVVAVLQEQITALQIADWGSNIMIANEANTSVELWIASFDQTAYPESYVVKGTKNEVIKEQWAHYYAKTPYFTIALTGQKKKTYDKYVFEETPMKRFPEVVKTHIYSMKEIYFSYARMKFGYIIALDANGSLSEENFALLQRFAKVFEQIYTRFLDLQKAEAQARAAQIEVAIERIRTKALAMHHSYEVKDVANIMRKELMNLGIEGVSAATIWIEQTKDKVRAWDFTNVQEASDSKDLGVDLILDLEKGQAHPNAYFWNVWNNKKETYSVVASDRATLYASMNWLVEMDEEMGKEMIHLLDTGQLTYWWHASASIEKGAITVDFAVPPPAEMAIILPKMAAAFDLAYRRFEDLQKAEAQAREAQIETALERVRARTMAMHKTDELREVVSVLFEQMNHLHLADEGCNINIFKEEINAIETWMAGLNSASFPDCYYMEGTGHPFLQKQWDKWRAQALPFHISSAGEELAAYAKYLLEETDLKRIPAEIKEMMLSIPELHFSFITFKYGQLEIVNTVELPSQEDLLVLTRFAKVFEQTYTRFLDLQKAEAQAKEAQIESALERVRAATMAMYKSDELRTVNAVVFQQLVALGFDIPLCGFIIYDRKNGDSTHLLSGYGTDLFPDIYHAPYFDHPYLNAQQDAWKEGTTFKSFVWEGALKKSVDDYYFQQTDLKILPPEIKDEMQGVRRVIISDAFMSHGLLEVNSTEPITEEQQKILVRFAKVFDQTYTRFLDLQKAETQAKEAQIEAALERVRSRTMAMHKSEDLKEVVKVLYQEMLPFGFDTFSCTIHLFHKETQNIEVWMEDMSGEKHLQSYFWYGRVHPVINEIWEAWEQKQTQIEVHHKEEEKEDFDNYLLEKTDYRQFPEAVKNQIRKEQEVYHTPTFFKDGFISITNMKAPSTFQKDILLRFTKVFEQTYTRFLDLQKAEAQAREAKIEAALERVRARAMAMRHSDELSAAAELLYQEFFKLGVAPFSCGYLINDEEKGEWKIWLTNPGEPFFKEYWTIPYTADQNLQARYQSWQRQEAFHCAVLEGAANLAHHQIICKYAPWKEEVTESLAPKFAFNSAHFSLGHLLVITPDRLSGEMEQAMVRFANVFDLTYRRFLDLEKAEEQNRQLEKTFEENQRLLHSILPEQIAEQIRAGQQTIVKRFEQVSILFADIVGFTILSEKITPQEVVDILNGLFSKFDDLTDKYGLEKIKTIGDAYMVASGVPEEKDNHALVLFQFAQDMLQAIQEFNQVIGTDLKIRIGISSGPVVAGVIGKKKFAYDLWGDSVNTAARMEANGRQDCIQVSPTTYAILKEDFVFEQIPNVEIKGKGVMDVYLWKNEK